MELTINTYGYIDAMFYIINGIAIIFSSSFTDLMIKAVALVATFYYGLQAAYAGTNGARQSAIKVFAMVIVINSLLIPKTSMLIEDHVTKQKDKVDNLPYGFAIPVGFLEQIGNILTTAFEQGFTAVGSSSYQNYGMVFGARLLQETRNWRIKTPEFAQNMDNFIRRCVIYDASIGHKYTINDLFDSPDVWSLVKSQSSNLRRVEMRIGQVSELKTCKDAVDTVISPAFTTELDRIKSRYLKSEFSLAGNISGLFTPRGTVSARGFLNQNIEDMSSRYLGSSSSAEANLRQFMMLNSLSDYARNYGYSRAAMTQESNWRIAGDLASMYLPILLSVMKGLVYASFIFIVPLMLLGGGIQKYLSYLSIVLSLQLWPALNAILNMFIDTYSAAEMSNLVGGAVSFSSFSKVGEYSDKIVAVASGIQMVIPYLAFTIIQGGVSGFINLAGNITGASQSSATNAAQELISNNRSFDNYSSGNLQIANNNGFKTDFNTSYRSGASELQNVDGSVERILSDGNSVIQSGMGLTMSGGGVKFTEHASVAAHLSKEASKQQAMLDSKTESWHEAQKQTLTKGAEWLSQIMEKAQNSKNFSYDEFGEQGKSVKKMVSLANSIAKDETVSSQEAAEAALKVSTGMGIGRLSVNAELNLSAKMQNSVDRRSSDSVNQENATQEDYNNIIRAGQNETYSMSHDIDKSISENLRQSYDQEKSLESAVSKQREVAERYQQAYTKTKSLDSSQDRDMYDVVQKSVATTYGVSSLEAHRMIESHDPRVNKIWDNIVESKANEIVGAQIYATQSNTSENKGFAALERFENMHKSKLDEGNIEHIKQHAKNKGLEIDNPNFVDKGVQNKFNKIKTENMNQNQEIEELSQKAKEKLND